MNRRFSLRLFVFILPFALISLIFLFFSWQIGVFMPFSQMVAIQSQDAEALVDLPLNVSWRYKFLTLEQRQPSIVILGSSRVLGFRDDLCNLNPSSFYNAGLRALKFDNMLVIGKALLDTHSPQLLILAIDQYAFNQDSRVNWPDSYAQESEFQIMLDNAYAFARETRTISPREWLHLLQLREPVHGNRAIQSNAILSGVGFRADGSYQFGKGELELNRQQLRQAFSVPRTVFAEGTELNQSSVQMLDEFLAYAASKNVQVIGFFPPFSPTSYSNNFSERETTHPYLTQAADTLQELFASYQFSFYDYTNPDSLHITDSMMLDSWHLSERSSLILFQALLASEPEYLAACSDPQILEAALAASSHDFLIFPPYQETSN